MKAVTGKMLSKAMLADQYFSRKQNPEKKKVHVSLLLLSKKGSLQTQAKYYRKKMHENVMLLS